MVKVLKSFDSAHSAVNWLTQNRIEDTSIETTGTLKSMGVGKIPYGNYHVVLKSPVEGAPEHGREFRAVPGTPAHYAKWYDDLTWMDRRDQNITDGEEFAAYNEEHPGALDAYFGTTDWDESHEMEFLDAVRGHWADEMQAILDRSRQANLTPSETSPSSSPEVESVPTSEPPKKDTAMQSISREDLVTVITKSVLRVLKGTFVHTSEDNTSTFAKLKDGSVGVPLTETNEKGMRGPASQSAVTSYFSNHPDSTIRESAAKASDPEHPEYKEARGHLEHAAFVEQTTGERYSEADHG